MEYRNYLRKYNSGKLQNVFLHIRKIIYEKQKQGHVKVKNINDNDKRKNWIKQQNQERLHKYEEMGLFV